MFGKWFLEEGLMVFSSEKLADALQVVESVKSLQTAQKEIANAVRALDDRIRAVEIEMRVIRAETTLHALKETQLIVNAVQGGLNQRIESLAVKVAIIENSKPNGGYIDSNIVAHDKTERKMLDSVKTE
jgi:hypothetical protein